MSTIPKETNSKAKIWFLYIESLFVIAIYILFSYILSEFVNSKVMFLYAIFTIYVALNLGLPSKDCKKRLGIQAIFIYLRKDKTFYKMALNVSKGNRKEQVLNETEEKGNDLQNLKKHFGSN